MAGDTVTATPLWSDKMRSVNEAALGFGSKLWLTSHLSICFYFSFLGHRGIAYPPCDDEGTVRTWSELGQRPRKRAPKRSVHGKQDVQSVLTDANKDTQQFNSG